MASVIYNSFKANIASGVIDLDTDTIKVMLVTSGYTPNQDTDTTRANITNEVVGTGYTAGGSALTGTSVTQDNTGNQGVFDANDLTWTTATITARGAVLYKSLGGLASADPLIKYEDFGSDKTSTGADFSIQWNAQGILLFT